MAGSRRAFGELVETVLVALVLALLVRAFVVESFRVVGNSMEPTLYDGERLFVNKMAYRFRPPQPGDIVVFRYPLNPSRDYIKRVVAVGGQTVEIRDGRVYVDGSFLEEPYVSARDHSTLPPVVLRPDEVYVLGDNRRNSQDSRVFGPFARSFVKGEAVLLYWPPQRIRLMGALPAGPDPAAPAASTTPAPTW